MGYRVYVREYPDKDGKMPLLGEVDTWLSLDFTVRFNAPGHWQMMLRIGTPHERLMRQGRGIVIFQDEVEDPVFSGTIDEFERFWSGGEHSGQGSLLVGGQDDNQIPFNYTAFPATEGYGGNLHLCGIGEQWKGGAGRPIDGVVGRAIWQECDLAFGNRALSDRAMPQVNVGIKPDIGFDIRDTLRYDNLGEKFDEWLRDKHTGYRFIYDPLSQKIQLNIFDSRNLSRTVRFSPDLGNIRQYTWQPSGPSVTRVMVACQGEGKQRYIYQERDSGAEFLWGRVVEQFIDRRDIPLKMVRGKVVLVTERDSDGREDLGTGPDGQPWPGSTFREQKFNATVYYKSAVREAARSALRAGEKAGHFQVYPIDTLQCRYGRDYVVGDIVSVEADGRRIVDKVREVTINVNEGNPDGEVSPKIGDQGSGHPLNLYKQVTVMREKIRLLEARV